MPLEHNIDDVELHRVIVSYQASQLFLSLYLLLTSLLHYLWRASFRILHKGFLQFQAVNSFFQRNIPTIFLANFLIQSFRYFSNSLIFEKMRSLFWLFRVAIYLLWAFIVLANRFKKIDQFLDFGMRLLKLRSILKSFVRKGRLEASWFCPHF